MTYVLLHESTHVVDKSCGITADTNTPLIADTWTGKKSWSHNWVLGCGKDIFLGRIAARIRPGR